MKLQTVKGTKDVLPSEIQKWHYIERTVRRVFERFGYEEIRTPVFEETSLFLRGIGETTDIVGKEMYTFQPDAASTESLTLRPEMTASVMRAYLQHSLRASAPITKVYYISELFRKERPQAGRQRQFWQFGCECIGSAAPEADAEVIALMSMIYRTLGVQNTVLRLNSLGNLETRKRYRDALREYLRPNYEKLDAISKERFEKNPLRILDSKNPDLADVIAAAPHIIDYLDAASRAHFETVQTYLKQFGIDYVIDFKLVRGLDYYSQTAFELQSADLGAQDALGGGGRYDGLAATLGEDKETPAVGFASGIERLIIVMEKLRLFDILEKKVPMVMFISQSDAAREWTMAAAMQCRQAGIDADVDLLRRSFKAQMKESNRVGAHYAVIAGENELQSGKFQLKNLATSVQEELTFNEILEKLKIEK